MKRESECFFLNGQIKEISSKQVLYSQESFLKPEETFQLQDNVGGLFISNPQVITVMEPAQYSCRL